MDTEATPLLVALVTPNAVVTPVEPISVRLFAVADDATAKLSALPVTPAVTPVRPPSAVLRPARSWTWPPPLPKVMTWLLPPFTATVSVELPPVPPAAMM